MMDYGAPIPLIIFVATFDSTLIVTFLIFTYSLSRNTRYFNLFTLTLIYNVQHSNLIIKKKTFSYGALSF